MDKIQKKLVELTENLTALDTCMAIGKLEYTDIILYFQYDIPIEKTNVIYSYMKDAFQGPQNASRYSLDERNEILIFLLRQLQWYITYSEQNGNMASKVYKDAYNVADEICKRLEDQVHPVSHKPTVLY